MKKLIVFGAAFVVTFGAAFVVVLTTPQPATALPPCEWQQVHWYFTDEECFTPDGKPGHMVTRCDGYQRECWYYDEFGECIIYSGQWLDCGCVEFCYGKPIPHEQEPPQQP